MQALDSRHWTLILFIHPLRGMGQSLSVSCIPQLVSLPCKNSVNNILDEYIRVKTAKSNVNKWVATSGNFFYLNISEGNIHDLYDVTYAEFCYPVIWNNFCHLELKIQRLFITANRKNQPEKPHCITYSLKLSPSPKSCLCISMNMRRW